MTGKERLAKLAEVLDSIEPDRFDLSLWADREDSCGTSACAVGHAAMHPDFIAEGLHLPSEPCGFLAPRYRGWVGWDAVEHFFDLKEDDAWHLFAHSAYDNEDVPPGVVAARIREFLAS